MMEENKNIELEQNQNNEEINKEESALEQEIVEEIDSDYILFMLEDFSC